MKFEVSVVVPTYNRADLIAETLDSILSQSHKPAEVIVVDDGSTDDTEAVVSRFGAAVQYVRIENSGECRARNVGALQAKAPWIAFCDSDDLWSAEKLLLQVRLFEAAPDAAYSFTNFRTVTDGNWSATTKFDTAPANYWKLSKRELGEGNFVVGEAMCESLLRHQPIFPSTLMMKHSFFEDVGRWREPLGRTPSVDLEFHFRCVARFPVGVVSKPVVGIRKHAANFSGDVLRTTIGETAVLACILENNPGAEQYRAAIEEEILRRTASAAELAFAGNKFELARQLIAKLPPHRRSWKLQVKSRIAHSPDFVARLLTPTATSLSGLFRSGEK